MSSQENQSDARHVASSDARIDASKMIDPFDISDFDDAGVDLPERLRTPDSLIARLERASSELRMEGDNGIAQPPVVVPEFVAPAVQSLADTEEWRSSSSLWSIVIRAYADVRCERSIDYVVADPEANILFLQRCWELGAPASPFELNWILMNARKAGRVGELPRAKRFSIPRERLDHFSFAVDIAMRAVQERLYYSEHREVSIDQVLCDPHLAREFDGFAKAIVPEQESLACRWAIMSLRKARRAFGPTCQMPTLDNVGLLEDVRVADLPRTCGTYWVRTGDGSLFTGVATNLRVQIDQLVQRMGNRVVPPWVKDVPAAKPKIVICGTDNYESGEVFRAGVFKHAGSRLNFWNGDFFGTAA